MRYRPEIDGLRAVSVLGVVLYHAGFFVSGTRILANGYLGVDVFFVISGYLITRLIKEDLSIGRFSLGSFYLRRVRRLLPALYIMVTVSLFFGCAILLPSALAEFGRTAIAALFFVSNIYFWSTIDYFSEVAELTPLLHLWSLGVEEQFYLFYPIMLGIIGIGVSRWCIAWLIIGLVISLTAALLLISQSTDTVFYIVIFRSWQFFAGGIVAWCHGLFGEPMRGRVLLPFLGLALILLAFMMPPFTGQLEYIDNIAVVSGAVIFIGWSNAECGPGRWMSARIPVLIGSISYSFYLWHQPIFTFARYYTLVKMPQYVLAALVFITFIVAYMSWRFVEAPFRRSGQEKTLHFLTGLGLSTGFIAVFAAVIISTDGLPLRFGTVARDLLTVEVERGTLVLSEQDCSTKTVQNICLIGAGATKPTWALLGDSHAETLADSLSSLLGRNGIAAEILTYPACPFVLGLDPVPTAASCSAFTAAVLEKLIADDIQTVIINDRFSAYMLGTPFDNGEGGVEPGEPFPAQPTGLLLTGDARVNAVADRFKQTIEKLLNAGVRVVYIAPVPEVGWHVPRAVAKLLGRGALPLTTSRTTYLERHARMLALLQPFKGRKNFYAIYPHEVFCSESTGRCATHSHDHLFYTDTDHLSREGAALLVEYLGKKLHDERIINSPGTLNLQ